MHYGKTYGLSMSLSGEDVCLKQGSHYILVLKFKDVPRTFKDPEVAFSRTNSRWKLTARTVLKQHVISISVITGQF